MGNNYLQVHHFLIVPEGRERWRDGGHSAEVSTISKICYTNSARMEDKATLESDLSATRAAVNRAGDTMSPAFLGNDPKAINSPEDHEKSDELIEHLLAYSVAASQPKIRVGAIFQHFLGVMMEALAPGGRCAVVVPEGLLSGLTTAHIELRRKLVEQFDLLGVISLPAGVFKPYAGVKTSVLVFRNIESGPRSTKKGKLDAKVWFYEVRADGYDPDKISNGGRPETPERNDIPDLLLNWAEFKRSNYIEAPGVEANTLLLAGSKEPRCWWAKVNDISGNNYILSTGRYKPQVADDITDKDPVALIHEIIMIEQDITVGLERLLRKVESAL